MQDVLYIQGPGMSVFKAEVLNREGIIIGTIAVPRQIACRVFGQQEVVSIASVGRKVAISKLQPAGDANDSDSTADTRIADGSSLVTVLGRRTKLRKNTRGVQLRLPLCSSASHRAHWPGPTLRC